MFGFSLTNRDNEIDKNMQSKSINYLQLTITMRAEFSFICSATKKCFVAN